MRTLLAFSALALASACTHPVDTAGAPSFGAAVEAMQEAQTAPGVVSAAPPEGSGAQGELAQERYRNGQTRPLMPATTSSANPTTN
ncbi:MAG: hypothetical protein AB7T59_07045 [Hyphomonadaceae bacterium]